MIDKVIPNIQEWHSGNWVRSRHVDVLRVVTKTVLASRK